MEKLTEDINKGLSKDKHDEAVVKCYTTYVQDLPNGTGNLVIKIINVYKILQHPKIRAYIQK